VEIVVDSSGQSMADALATITTTTNPSFALLAVAFGVFVRPPALAIASVIASCELNLESATRENATAATADLDTCLESFLLLR